MPCTIIGDIQDIEKTTDQLKSENPDKVKVQSWVEGENCKGKCFKCYNTKEDDGDSYVLCIQDDCPEEDIPTFDNDPLLKDISGSEKYKLTNLRDIYGITPDSYMGETGGINFYESIKDDTVYLRVFINGDKIQLIKVINNKPLTSNSTWTKQTFLDHLTNQDKMKVTFKRVSSLKNPTNETKKTMKNILKEEYQKRENDKNIISKRFNILSESKKTWTASNLISEVSYLKKQNYSSILIKEGLVELMKSLYDDDPTFIPKIKDSYKGWLMKKLPNESELFKKSLETSIEDLENDSVPALFTDCNKVVEMMYEAMIRGMVDEKFDVVGVPKDIEDLLRSEIVNNIKKDEFKSKVKQQLTNKICPQYGDLLRNTQKTFDDIKNKLVS
jgi:hypothetical protein